jgi:hypothetical protein
MSSRNKTVKRSVEPSMSTDQFQNFLSVNAEEAYNRPWHKLERGLRLNRLRAFAEAEKERANYSDDETKALLSIIMKSFDKKLLNTKNVVVYDETTTKITEIKGLVMHRAADGKMMFQILEKKTGVTFRKPRTSVATAAKPNSPSET